MAEGLIIIPAFNEGKNIGKVLHDIKRLNFDIDTIVINDGSKDNTAEIAEKQGAKVINHIINLGYGAALQTGFKYAVMNNYKYVLQFDGDGQHDPKDIPHMIEAIQKENIDIVIGSRFIGKSDFKASAPKKIVINFMKLLIDLLTGYKITDPTCGLKALSKRTFKYYSIAGNFPSDYPDADILIKMLRKRYIAMEVPVNIRYRNYGTSMHSGLKPVVYIFKIMLSILVILLRQSLVKEQ